MSPLCCSGVSVQPASSRGCLALFQGRGEASLCQRRVPSRETGPGCQADAHLCTWGRGPHGVWGRRAEQRDTCRPSILVPPPPHPQGKAWPTQPPLLLTLGFPWQDSHLAKARLQDPAILS